MGNNGTGVSGINWNVTIMPLKFLDASGNGYTSDAIRAINYATMEHTTYGVNVRVINASWDSSASDPGLTAAIQAAGNAGILVVAAAGNAGTNNDTAPQYPASSSLANVVSVAASDASNNLASFSDYGASTVSLAAPGVEIYSTLPGNQYGYLSGTSMAAPEVAGVAALAWAADPSATVAQVKSALLAGVTKLPSLSGKVVSGGVLNAYNTLKLLAATTPVSPSPVSPAPSPTPVSTTPTIASLAVSASTMSSGGSVSVVAQGVSTNGTSVYFYLDSNANGTWDSGDALIASTASISGGQAGMSWNTTGFATGAYRIFARTLARGGLWSAPVGTTVTVTAKLPTGTSAATAVPIGIGSTAAGNLVNASGASYFQVQLAAGQTYTFQTVLCTLYDSVLTLVGSSGQTVLAQNDDMGPGTRASKITWQATAGGVYYLAVSSYPGSPLGTFSLVTSQATATSSSSQTSKNAAAPVVPATSAAAIMSSASDDHNALDQFFLGLAMSGTRGPIAPV